MELHEKRLKMKAELELTQTKPEIQECSEFKTAKLPKFVISKFDGSFMDWPRFWGQFSEAIDKSSIAPITKFTYLRELLSPKAKVVSKPCHFRQKVIIGPSQFFSIDLERNRRLSIVT